MKITNVVSTLVFTSIVFVISFSGCRVYHTHSFDRPCVEVPDEFLNDPEEGVGNISEWWREFRQPKLNSIMEEALENNLDIKQAWSRLAQARASACIANSARYPEINVEALAGKHLTTFKPAPVPDTEAIESFNFTYFE